MIYSTIREAALAGLKVAVALSRENDSVEYGGFIIRAKSGYTFTPPHTSGKQEGLDDATDYVGKAIGYTPTAARGFPRLHRDINKAGLVGHFHTHPCSVETVVGSFSASDIDTSVHHLGFEHEYMAETCTGQAYESQRQDDTKLMQWHLFASLGLGGMTGEDGIKVA